MTLSNLPLLASGPVGDMLIFAAVAVGCFVLTAKAFSAEGLPFTRTVYIKGPAAKFLGVLTGLLGVGFAVFALLVMIASTQVP